MLLLALINANSCFSITPTVRVHLPLPYSLCSATMSVTAG
jgi:hypothetical protein